MIIVTGSFVAKQGQLPAALAASLEHVRRSRLELGCISHAVHHDVENPQRLVFLEEWADMAALSAHFVVPASRAFGKAIAGFAAEPPAMAVFEASRVKI